MTDGITEKLELEITSNAGFTEFLEKENAYFF